MNGIQVLELLIGASAGLFLLISAVVVLPGRMRAGAARTVSADAVWFGGPFRCEREASVSDQVLVGRPAVSEPAPQVDWVALAELAEPGRRVGGASARW
ncbi:hypothetical protein AB0395_13185 [Streptosporangium sp. NPDC051023]|uniref:hypothetical protein n=1 Tax=Streptosporangium sp. NPDC051023 TaxID=3155410 RepID=UPI00344DC181